MWLIDRGSNGLGESRITLPEPVRTALVRWYSGEGSRGDEEAGIILVQQARKGAKWLACDCLPTGQLPPILTPAFLSEAETYYLRRLTNITRPEHDARCPFFRDQVTNRITQTRSPQTPAEPPDGYFEVVKPAPQKLAQRPGGDISDDRTRNASVPKLARLLWRLIASARLNIVPARGLERAERSITDEFAAFRAVAAKIEIAPGIELGRALWTHGQALHSQRAYAGIRALERQWPQGHAPQGFLLVFAQAFRGSTLYVAGCDPLSIANRVQSPSVRDDPIKGPYLGLVVISKLPEAHGYAALSAYAQPIFSGTRFVPVSSESERAVLRAILNARRTLERAGIDVIIEKPVYDLLTPLGACRPGFLVEARFRSTGEVRKLIIEASDALHNGLIPDGGSRKALEQIAPVLDLSIRDIQQGNLAHRLLATLTL